ncbi:MAG TPA: Ig-like domain-containing protein [Rhodothermales bacterium]|nr:Ig-like domain-containing protein [Rhodothermales bacterium]
MTHIPRLQVFPMLARRLAVLAVTVVVAIGCQELPTEPTPIDLSRDHPIAVDDTIATPEETLVSIAVLANDSSLVGDELKVAEIVTPPSFGEATIVGNLIEYLPEVDYNGSDSLRYRVSGNVLSSTARVLISVTPVNDPPVANDDTFTIEEGQAAVLDVLANDTDVDGDVLRVIRTSNGPQNGSVQIPSDGFSVAYEPSTHFNGTDQFVYTISDGNGGQDFATVTVHVTPVNDPPSAVNWVYATLEDSARSEPAPGVLAGATDPDGDQLTAVLIEDVEHGTLSLQPDGSFRYVPEQDFNGADGFVFAAFDGILQSAPATVTINVIAVNDPPVAAPDAYTTEEDVTLEVPAPGVLANDVDVDGDELTITLITSTEHGSLDLRNDGSFTYSPDAGFSGDDSFEYQIDDGTLASRATVSITVIEVSDPPRAEPDQYDVPANTDLVVPPPGVLENDSDEEGTALVAVLADSPDGVLELDADGGFAYSPPPGFSGTDSFTYRASDGVNFSAVTNVVILVTAQGTPPVAMDDEFIMTVNDTLRVPAPGVLENDSDADGDDLSVVLVTDVVDGILELALDGGFVYTPPENFVGVATFTYRARDGANVSQIAFVRIAVTG